MHRTLRELLNRFETDLPEKVLSGRVLKIHIDKQTDDNELIIESQFDEHINDYELFTVEKQIGELLETKVSICPSFIPECYFNGIVTQTINDTATQIPMLSGIMSECDTELNGENLIIRLKNGGKDLLEKSNFEQIYIREIKNRFGINLKLTIEGRTEFSSEEYEKEKKEADIEFIKTMDAFVPPEKKTVTGLKNLAKLPIKQDSIRQIAGKVIKSTPVSLKEVSEESGVVTVWGDVFKVADITTRDGSKRIFSFYITDDKSSQIVKAIVNKAKKAQQLS